MTTAGSPPDRLVERIRRSTSELRLARLLKGSTPEPPPDPPAAIEAPLPEAPPPSPPPSPALSTRQEADQHKASSRLVARLEEAGYDTTAIREYRKQTAAQRFSGFLQSHADSGPIGWAWLIPLGWMAIVYALLNFGLALLSLPPWLDFYVVRPLLWASLIYAVYRAWKQSKLGKIYVDNSATLAGGLMGGVQIAIMIILGILFQFGSSPYSHRLLPMLGNILHIGTMLLGVEYARNYLVRLFSRRSATLAVVLSAVLFSLVLLPFRQITRFASPAAFVQILGEMILPTMAESMLASFLSLTGGPLAAIAYRGLLEAFEWLSPILPNVEWIVTALVGTLVPVIGLVTIQDLYAPEAAEGQSEPKSERSDAVGWLIISIVAVALIWFNTGALGYEPSVLSGPSMQPTIWAGDLVITKKMPAEDLQVGDIIKFYQDGKFVIHRVIEINNFDGQVTIITQGDNVNAPDDPITEGQVVGKVVAILPKVGYVSVWFRELLALIKTLL
ncbi:MAG: hypothetical protein Kow00124_31920 [Anaerolineae bacterium]